MILFLFSFSFSFAENKKTVTLSDSPWPPYSYGKEGGKPTGGIAVHYTNELFRRLNVKTDIKLYPWKRCLNQMQEGRRDGLIIALKTKERDKYMVFSDVVITERLLVWYKKGRNIQWKKFKNLKKYSIGITAGFSYGDAFDKAANKYSFALFEASNDLNNFKNLDLGRIDIFICNESVANALFKKNKDLVGKFEHSKKILKFIGYHMGFSKKSKYSKNIKKINNVIKQMKKDGTMNKIFNKNLRFK